MSTIVKFNDGFPEGCPSWSAAYTEWGMIFTNTTGNYWCSPRANNFFGISHTPSTLIVARSGGQKFALRSMRICNVDKSMPAQKVPFTGTRNDGTLIRAEAVTASASTAVQTFAPDGFRDLVRLEVGIDAVAFGDTVFDLPVAQTVDFTKIVPVGSPTEAMILTAAGLSFTNTSGNRWNHSSSKDKFVSTATFGGHTTVAPTAGGTFDFQSLQVCNLNSANAAQIVTFVGRRPDGTEMEMAFATPPRSMEPQFLRPLRLRRPFLPERRPALHDVQQSGVRSLAPHPPRFRVSRAMTSCWIWLVPS